MKKCSKCGKEKAESEFDKHKRTKSGLHAHCKSCRSLYSHQYYLTHKPTCYKRMKQWNNKNPERRRAINTAWQSGMSVKERESFLENHGSVCEICGLSRQVSRDVLKVDLCIDHCHKTGLNKGVLCMLCNAAAGSIKDNPELAFNLWKYLERTRMIKN